MADVQHVQGLRELQAALKELPERFDQKQIRELSSLIRQTFIVGVRTGKKYRNQERKDNLSHTICATSASAALRTPAALALDGAWRQLCASQWQTLVFHPPTTSPRSAAVAHRAATTPAATPPGRNAAGSSREASIHLHRCAILPQWARGALPAT